MTEITNKLLLKLENLLGTNTPSMGLLAVSGGLDSVVLAHLFKMGSVPFSIVHCNFQLRGTESDMDADFVQHLADELGVTCQMTQFETKKYAEEQGISTQMAARVLRYQWFESIAKAHEINWVATAHHLNDQIETTLLNFARGTGLSGLRGMAELSVLPHTKNMHLALIRPLLTVSRAELEVFAQEHGITWREDSSNQSDDYNRNYVRHHLVPNFQVLNPNFIQTAARNINKLQSADENLRFLLQHLLHFDETTYRIDVSLLKALPAPDQALYLLLQKYGFTEDQVNQTVAHLSSGQFYIFSATGVRLFIHQGILQIVTKEVKPKETPLQIHENDVMIRLPNHENLFLIHCEPLPPFPDGKDSIMINSSLLKYPLTWRSWQPGDAFRPFGMDGKSQKLQDFFTNLKLSPLEKEEIKVLVNGDGKIIWILGYRSSDLYKITQRTVKALKIVRN